MLIIQLFNKKNEKKRQLKYIKDEEGKKSVGWRDRKIAAKCEIINSMLEVYFAVGTSRRTMLSN